MTAFAYLTYTGTLEQWRGFLAQKSLLPVGFAHINIDFELGKSFRYHSKRMSLAFDHGLQKVQKDSVLSLRFSYLENGADKDGANVTWDVAGISLTEKKSGGPTVHVSRRLRPEPSLPDNFQSEWAKMVAREYPYNATVIENDGDTTIETMFPLLVTGLPSSPAGAPRCSGVKHAPLHSQGVGETFGLSFKGALHHASACSLTPATNSFETP